MLVKCYGDQKINPCGFKKYSYVFVGVPVWWYREPSIIDTFIESYDWDGITVIPFCTSGGSGLGDAGKNMQALGKGAKVIDGKRLSVPGRPG
ncbi:MAG: hypothetical protein K6C35_06640 [Eubacterium sp.]|nr:hypothetical protein [Eubacterium sp.]